MFRSSPWSSRCFEIMSDSTSSFRNFPSSSSRVRSYSKRIRSNKTNKERSPSSGYSVYSFEDFRVALGSREADRSRGADGKGLIERTPFSQNSVSDGRGMGDETEKEGGGMKRRRYVLIVGLGNDGMIIKDVVYELGGVKLRLHRLPRPAAGSGRPTS